ncbi:hypothetical protein A3762_05385 [Oleiphilus sp. HI0125]|uniref:tRNA (adenosine(37)-N6)-threonylcarbamoyltransferase complex dimerization subunit type 1 TsaB n=2 Tax=Oleiphilus sp. HI0125 TaxID=1822266 RepID=UPI0007C24586|nr:tRNA (adenosine(37)-N6)-threonylcarbamoyltransferase complex dimerization subunit type 1 TsaB [Oleiphilus sp. HI0125]KZZ59285.1 hypothetical protein A3762_05385 [Oleiphilus sp. HI0125]
MTAILAVDTSSKLCSVTLLLKGECGTELFSKTLEAARSHVQHVLPMVKVLLEEAGLKLEDVDALAFGQGPGSFTGLRIATGFVQGIAFGKDIPVVGVSNLRALAHHVLQNESEQNECFVLIDARMDEIYWSVYERDIEGFPKEQLPESVDKPERVADALKDHTNMPVFGSGLAYKDRISLISNWSECEAVLEHPSRAIAELALIDFEQGKAVSAEQAAPVYIRDQVAWKKLPGRE